MSYNLAPREKGKFIKWQINASIKPTCRIGLETLHVNRGDPHSIYSY